MAIRQQSHPLPVQSQALTSVLTIPLHGDVFTLDGNIPASSRDLFSPAFHLSFASTKLYKRQI